MVSRLHTKAIAAAKTFFKTTKDKNDCSEIWNDWKKIPWKFTVSGARFNCEGLEQSFIENLVRMDLKLDACIGFPWMKFIAASGIGTGSAPECLRIVASKPEFQALLHR